MDYILGESNEDIILDAADDIRDIANSLARQAKLSVNIFTQDLEPEIYDNDEFHDSLFNLVSSTPKAEIKILAIDSSKAIRNSHRLIRLAQKLTSFITIKNPCEEFRTEKYAFMTVDKSGFIYRSVGDKYNYHAAANFMLPPRVKEIDSLFDTIWSQSELDPHARRIFM